MDNPNEVFNNTQNNYQPLNALIRAKSKIMATKNKPKSANTMQEIPQLDLHQNADASVQMQSPFEGKFKVSQEFGNYNPKLYQGVTADAKHHGVDFATPSGTQIKSPIAGNVEVGQNKWYGNYVKIKADDGTTIQFSHLSSVDDLLKQIDQKRQVLAGQLLGRSGNTGYSTGAHTDVMAWRGGQQIDPMTLSVFQNARL